MTPRFRRELADVIEWFKLIASLAVTLMLAALFGCLLVNTVRAAERENDVVHVIVACLRNPVETACRELATFETRTDCAIAVERVAVRMSGARLTCAVVDRVRR